MKKPIVLIWALALVTLAGAAKAQDSADDQGCTGPVYSRKELSRPLKIISKPAPKTPSDRRAREVEGRVILGVVACHNGKITFVKVIEGLPYGVTEETIKAARKVKFRPAEKDGQAASQYLTLEYVYNIVSIRP